jgi:hypothetical protein
VIFIVIASAFTSPKRANPGHHESTLAPGREDEGVTKDHYEGKLPEIALAGLKALEAKSHNEEKQ